MIIKYELSISKERYIHYQFPSKSVSLNTYIIGYIIGQMREQPINECFFIDAEHILKKLCIVMYNNNLNFIKMTVISMKIITLLDF